MKTIKFACGWFTSLLMGEILAEAIFGSWIRFGLFPASAAAVFVWAWSAAQFITGAYSDWCGVDRQSPNAEMTNERERRNKT